MRCVCPSRERLGVRVAIRPHHWIGDLVSSALSPVIEWRAGRIPERHMGVFGVLLIPLGFSLQSVQYWITLLDVPVH